MKVNKLFVITVLTLGFTTNAVAAEDSHNHHDHDYAFDSSQTSESVSGKHDSGMMKGGMMNPDMQEMMEMHEAQQARIQKIEQRIADLESLVKELQKAQADK